MATPWMRPRVSGDVISAQIFPPPADVPNRKTWGITSKRCDVAVDPLQHGDLIKTAVVSRSLLRPFGVERRMRQEPECAKAQVVADEHNALGHELLAIVNNTAEYRSRSALTGKGMITTAREPHHNRQWSLCLLSGAPDVEVKTVFVAFNASRDLETHCSIATAITHAIPSRHG
jgi:hypothetical protein